MRDDLAEGNDTRVAPAPSPHEQATDAPPLSQDNVFDALSSKRGRYVLVALREAGGPLDFGELVETVAAWETGKPIDLVSGKHRERVRTSLRHSQLPKLAMMGLVEYDEAESAVERGPHAEQADPYLDIAVSRDENVTG